MADIGKTVGMILCGGQSSRMGGGDKSLVQLGASTMLRRIVDRLGRRLATLAINANGDAARFSTYALPVFPDTVAGFAGPLAGILAGMRWASGMPGCQNLLTVAGDTPFFPDDLAERLADAAVRRPGHIAVATSGGRRHPVFALWPVGLADDLEGFLNRAESRRVNAFIDSHQAVEVDFSTIAWAGRAFDPFFNVNTPEDLAEARRFAEFLDQ